MYEYVIRPKWLVNKTNLVNSLNLAERPFYFESAFSPFDHDQIDSQKLSQPSLLSGNHHHHLKYMK